MTGDGLKLISMRKTALLLLSLLPPAAAWAAEPLPQEIGVVLQKPTGDGVTFSTGSGVYLGAGLVLTADHVVHVDPAHPGVKVLLPERALISGDVVMEGTDYSPDLDIALIRLDMNALTPSRRDETPTLVCPANPGLNIPMTVAAQGKISSAMTIPQPMERLNNAAHATQGWTNILSTGYPHGASGGGVFDPVRNCLEGIISLELSDPSRGIDLTSFIPASRIAPFLDAYYRRNPVPTR